MSSALQTVAPPPRVLFPEKEDRVQDWIERFCVGVTGLVLAPAPGLRARRLARIVKRVEACGAEFGIMDEPALKIAVRDLRTEFTRYGLEEKLIARAFALIREIADRTLGMRHFDVQLIGGFAMLKGMVAEMQTGEGKTLAATLPAATAALAGIPVHMVTVNDYLAKRDAEWMTPVYEALGLTVGVVLHGMDADTRRAAYRCDVTYCTNKELTFDYLRDQMALGEKVGNLRLKVERCLGEADRTDRLVMQGLAFAIVDEADSVLIDEARTPLIISGAGKASEDRARSEQAIAFAKQLEDGIDYRIRHDERLVELSDLGKARLRELTEPAGDSWAVAIVREELVTQAISAHHLFHRDEHYLVRDGKVQIIDEYTGRVMPDRFWNEGLHQMIEVKENCEPSDRRTTLARITYQRFFRRYQRLAGMTGTAREVSRELWSVFGLRVAAIPTNRRCRRIDLKIQIASRMEDKLRLVTDRVAALSREGRPVLIGTRSVAASEKLSGMLSENGITHRVLNAAQDVEEAEIIAHAGEAGRVTVATNMAGRGTDIKLQPSVADRGGLHVIISERHDAGRIDRQLAGRCARQGDPGSVEYILSLEDSLLEAERTTVTGRVLQLAAKRFGTIFAGFVFDLAQRHAERKHSRVRRDLLKHDQRLGKALAFTGSME